MDIFKSVAKLIRRIDQHILVSPIYDDFTATLRSSAVKANKSIKHHLLFKSPR